MTIDTHRYRCVDGRLMRHDPAQDDPDLETDRGVCPECNGVGRAACCAAAPAVLLLLAMWGNF